MATKERNLRRYVSGAKLIFIIFASEIGQKLSDVAPHPAAT